MMPIVDGYQSLQALIVRNRGSYKKLLIQKANDGYSCIDCSGEGQMVLQRGT